MSFTSNIRVLCCLAALAAIVALAVDPALAQMAQRPFAVPGGEGGGRATGIAGWLLSEQAALNHLMTANVKALHSDGTAVWELLGLSFAYGVFHAAGPGHGKALIASYMLANERALRRGIVLAFLAAILQAFVAIALVSVAALLFNATSAQMNRAANVVEIASYLGIAAIGGWLVWTKGHALAQTIRLVLTNRSALASASIFADAPWRPALAIGAASQYRAESPGVATASEAECGHLHAPDPAQLGDGFSWRGAAATVVAAGARPCSGAILILVFALAQGLYAAGVGSALAMALGTALTTGALASLAVYAKAVAVRFARGDFSRTILIARTLELLAALVVLAFGLALLFGAGSRSA